ncbi:PTS sugar transporter subunit IIA [Enterococcus canintestini]|uniref:PTS EIIA type-4 domain-containing protein n=1 Tax=Enterococcus canintestini TaxID=317010 RepID=A0A267HTE9_9ENTE|nr:hypothetical protein [Enterococcus canintestini]PAB01616.1 hypothetical protein AKL21_03965 [Enterococcus canintestini]
MYKIIVTSHGPLAEAMKESLKFFFSDVDVMTVSIDERGLVAFQAEMDRVFQQIGKEDVLIFTDLLYGTPFNESAKRVADLDQFFEIIAGVSMPLLVEAVNYQRQQKNLAEITSNLLEIGKPSSFKEKIMENVNTEDE